MKYCTYTYWKPTSPKQDSVQTGIHVNESVCLLSDSVIAGRLIPTDAEVAGRCMGRGTRGNMYIVLLRLLRSMEVKTKTASQPMKLRAVANTFRQALNKLVCGTRNHIWKTSRQHSLACARAADLNIKRTQVCARAVSVVVTNCFTRLWSTRLRNRSRPRNGQYSQVFRHGRTI